MTIEILLISFLVQMFYFLANNDIFRFGLVYYILEM